MALVASVAGIGWVRVCAPRRTPRPVPTRRAWPVLLVARGSDTRAANDALTRAGVAWEPAANDENRTAALALGSLTPIELEALRRALDDLDAHLEALSDPMVEDLDDSDPMAALATLIRNFLPALTACDAIASRRRAAPDGTMVVAIATQCDPSMNEAGVACDPLWKSPAAGLPVDRSVQRARFLEWPVAAAVVVGFTNAADAHRATASLRARSHDAGSRIGLALEEEDLAGQASHGIDDIRTLARHIVALAERDPSVDRHMLELIGRDAPQGARLIPWLRLDAEEVLAVPRLGALADLPAFVREVEATVNAVMPAGETEWVRLPDPIR